jgi:hypothetical protein
MSEPYSPPVAQVPSGAGNNQPLKGNGFGTAALVLGIDSDPPVWPDLGGNDI